MARYPRFYWPQGTVDMFEPIAPRSSKKASIRREKMIQNHFTIVLLKALLTKAKKPKRAVTKISPVSCQA